MRVKKQKRVTATQLFINYMNAVNGKEQLKKLFASLYKIVEILEKKNIQTDVYFRGSEKRGTLSSEPMSNEIWYWQSNGFVKEVKGRILYTETAKIHFWKDRSFNVNWNLDSQTKSALINAINQIKKCA